MNTEKIHVYLEDKKTEHADLNKKRPLLLSLGLFLSILLVTMAFEFRQKLDQDVIELTASSSTIEEIIDIPPTEINPPPPTLQLPQVVEVPNEEEAIQEIEVSFDIEVNTETKLQEISLQESAPLEVERENTDEVFLVVEESATPQDGMPAFYKFVNETIKYPAQARRMGVEGKVFVEFVVSKEGTLTDLKVVKGIGAGCDEEAIRVVKLSPPWQAGKQRGRPVRQRIVLPIFFVLYKG